MPLSDPKYLIFLFTVVMLFYVLRGQRLRSAVLLLASYVFYFNLSRYYSFVLIFVTIVAYSGGILLTAKGHAHRRNLLLALCCVILLAPLIILKYLEFVVGVAVAIGAVPGSTSPFLHLAMPVGISFFTFAALGYLIDVYLEVIGPTRRLLDFALFTAFFPLVTAGPIERADSFLPQFDFHRLQFNSASAFAAARLIFLGLFLKVVCADTLVKSVDTIYANPRQFIALEQLFGLVHYMFYVYADFAGYSLIAIGSALFFQLEVRPNFKQPFLSRTTPEFWRNWHISLSSWVRDYLFTPLRTKWRRYAEVGMIGAVMVSFLVLGIWHGAGWGFVLFGLMHGLLVSGSILTLKHRDAIWSAVGIPTTLVHISRVFCTFVLVMLTFVVFRANSLHDAGYIYRHIFSADLIRSAWHGARLHTSPPDKPTPFQVISFSSITWVIIGLLMIGDIVARRAFSIEKLPLPVQITIYNVGIGLIVWKWIENTAAQPFLYYRF